MKKLLLIAVFCLFGFAVQAANTKIDVEKLPLEGGKQADVAEPVTAQQQAALICQSAQLMGQKLKGAAYVPGVDAYGNPVEPADVYNSMPFEVPDEIQVPINMDVMAVLGVTASPVEGKGEVGTLTIQKGGTLFFNEQDITNNIETYCTEHLKKMKTEDKKQ